MVIHAIGQDDIHRITSGQVIVDLSSAVKEMVENSLDAGATQIEVVFKNHGLDMIEVSDNGHGIPKEDFDSICMKHHTSKLSSFEEVNHVGTFGFRGEAMSSLCAVANVSMVTATKQDAPVATRLVFGHSGAVQERSVVSGKRGTVTSVANFFEPLPVRRKDLTRNSRREFQRSLMLLQSYAVICVGVRFIISHIPPSGKKNVVLATKCNKDMKQNIRDVFGPNGMNGLTNVDFEVEVASKFRLKGLGQMRVRVHGYVSNSSFGQGRSATDRQLAFINGRPVQFPQVLKAISEEYRQFNHVQYPVVFIDLEVGAEFLDLNVTPDKKLVLIHNEEAVIESIREEMKVIFSENDFVMPKSRPIVESLVISQRQKSEKLGDQKEPETPAADVHSQDMSGSEPEEQEVVEELELLEVSEDEPERKQTPIEVLAEPNEESEPERENDSEGESEYESEAQPEECLDTKGLGDSPKPTVLERDELREPSTDEVVEAEQYAESFMERYAELEPSAGKGHNEEILEVMEEEQIDFAEESEEELAGSQNLSQSLSSFRYRTDTTSFVKASPEKTVSSLQDTADGNRVTSSKRGLAFLDEARPIKQYKVSTENDTYNLEQTVSYKRTRLTIPKFGGDFKEIPIDITDREAAELGLTLKVSKSDFEKMKIIGQFNLGFIITRSHQNDLFIVDQHASDEKYNFEKLQNETVFESQPLVVPIDLNLNPIDELIVMDHHDVFDKNGFKLKIDEDKPPGDRIRLVSLPTAQRTVFDLDDLNELIHILKDGTGKHSSRPSKIRAMFAMRACRMSIMVGRSLNHKTMQQVVSHLAELDKPWNCPHGRPTMRHLLELNSLKPFNKDYEI